MATYKELYESILQLSESTIAIWQHSLNDIKDHYITGEREEILMLHQKQDQEKNTEE